MLPAPALPIHKGQLCPGNTAHLGLGGRGCLEHSATVKAGQTRLCAPWPRCRRKRGQGRSVNGPPSCPAHASSSVLIPSPLKYPLPLRSQHTPSMSLAADLSCFDKHPSQPSGLWLFCMPSFMWLGTNLWSPEQRLGLGVGTGYGGWAWPSNVRGGWNPGIRETRPI